MHLKLTQNPPFSLQQDIVCQCKDQLLRIAGSFVRGKLTKNTNQYHFEVNIGSASLALSHFSIKNDLFLHISSEDICFKRMFIPISAMYLKVDPHLIGPLISV